MKVNRLILVLLSVVMAGTLSACAAASTAWPGVTVSDSTAYLADGPYVYAVNLDTGAELTRTVGNESQPVRFPQSSNSQVFFFAPPVLTPDGQLLVGSAGHSNHLYSLDPATFEQNWVFDTARDVYLGSPLVFEDRIYAPNGDGNLYMLDLKGNLLGTFDTSEHGLWSAPVTDGETLYLSSLDHSVYALDPKTLAVKWSAELDGAVNASPTLSGDGRLYVGTLNKTLYAIDAASGEVLWSRGLAGWLYSAPTLDDGVIYIGAVVGATGGKVYAIDAENGAPQWEFDTIESTGNIIGAVAGRILVVDDTVLFATEKGSAEKGSLVAVTKNGEYAWHETYEHNFYAGPIQWNDALLLAPSQSPTLLLSVNPGSGSIKWKFPPEE